MSTKSVAKNPIQYLCLTTKINTMKKTLLLMFALLVASIGMATAQTLTVTGTVVAESDGQPVVGAYVLVNGTTLGTITKPVG